MAEKLVNVEQGYLKGNVEIDFTGKAFYSFTKIPYAKPPLGHLRFKGPEPAEPWTGILDATNETPQCYSPHMITWQVDGTEDCLYLNVYTPNLPDSNNLNAVSLPVMFWIHGGAFMQGSSRREFYSPEFLVGHDVVLVTINYRVGLLGFLSLEDPILEVPGNAGLKDMVLALQWVQKNIAQFGGNSHNVTIFGESAGAAAVEYLTLSPLTKGLFHRAIMQSGSVLCPWAVGRTHTAETLANALEVKTTNLAEILRILKELPVEKLLEVQNKLPPAIFTEARPLGPVVEKYGTDGAFLTEDPQNLLKTGKFHSVPLLVSYTKEEGILLDIFLRNLGAPPIYSDLEDYVPKYLKLKRGSEKSKILAEEIKRFYYGDKEPSSETSSENFNLGTDSLFLHALYNTIRIRLTNSNQPIYFCRFSVDTGLNFYKKANNAMNIKGACHADDLGYLFKTFVTPTNIEPNSVEHKSIERVTKLWTNFAKFGTPIQEKEPLINIEWKPVEAGKFHYLDINDELSAGINPDYDRVSFWDNVNKKCGGQNFE